MNNSASNSGNEDKSSGVLNGNNNKPEDKDEDKNRNKKIFIFIGIIVAIVIIIIVILLLLSFCRKDNNVATTTESIEETTESEATETAASSESLKDSSITEVTEEENSVETEETGKKSPESAEPVEESSITVKEAPTISLKIYDGPTYSPADNVCYYRIEASVTGIPAPTVVFSKDDSAGAFGSKKAQVNLNNPSATYTLTATATNSAGSSTATIVLEWGCNRPPVIDEITMMGDHFTGIEYTVSAAASDPDGDVLTYAWSVTGGTIVNSSTNPIKWTTPYEPESCNITVTVNDGKGGTDTMTETVEVTEQNRFPVVEDIIVRQSGTPYPAYEYYTGFNYDLYIEASDPDGDPLTYSWSVSAGSISNSSSNPAGWTAPFSSGNCNITVTVSDGRGGTATRTETVFVKYYLY